MLADGSIARPLDVPGLEAVLHDIAGKGVEAIAVSLLWSIVNPAHELEIARLIEAHLPGIPYTLSHQLNPSIREYRRAMSTAIDASLKPIMGHYMRSLDSRLRAEGFGGRLLVVTSQGGVMDAVDVAEAPVHLLNSGPSMAPIGARAYCGSERTQTLIVGDTGGTTFDVSLIRGGRIPRTRETWLGRPLVSHLTGMPSVDIKSIGAGGGSIAWVDAGGLLHVGPISAGSDPGPACYALGGKRPTVTDASVVLGFLDPDNFLGGRMKLDRDLAIAAIREHVAEPLGVEIETAAAAILELATEHMVQAILDITVNQGVDPKEAAFVAGGGVAGLNCAAIGRRLGCKWVFVPETGAALAASGALVSDLVSHLQAMFHTTSEDFDFAGAKAVLGKLEAECHAFHARTGAYAELAGIHWSVEARYPDQAWEIEVPLRSGSLATPEDVAQLVNDFHTAQADVFAINDPNSGIELIGWNAAVHCRIGEQRTGRVMNQASANPTAKRRIYFRDTGWIDVPVVEFDAVADGATLVGPAILESGFTSIIVESGDLVTRDASGMIVIENSRYGAEA